MEAKVFENWVVKELLGEGAFGKVYRIEREDFGVKYEAALKKIVIPQSPKEISEAINEGMDEESVARYFLTFVEEIVSEFQLMSKLKGHTNIVSYEDHKVTAHEDSIGWDVLIRMELLTSLADVSAGRPFTEKEVIKLGRDICQALEVCRRYDIIHRDIKPENIFISELGDYKLGDFGIARTVEKTMSNLSKKGTYNYMAPEVYKGETYGSSVDIYSLGIVMYRFMNNNRMPFLPPFPEPISYSNRESAIAKRMAGEVLPEPCNGSDELKRIVLKACAYRAEDRYASPEEMRMELEKIMGDVRKEDFIKQPDLALAEVFNDDGDRTIGAVSVWNEAVAEEEKTVSIFQEVSENKTETKFEEKAENSKRIEKEHSIPDNKVSGRDRYGMKLGLSYLFIVSGWVFAIVAIPDDFRFIHALMNGYYFEGVLYNYMNNNKEIFILAIVFLILTLISGFMLLAVGRTGDKLPADKKKTVYKMGLVSDIIVLGEAVFCMLRGRFYPAKTPYMILILIIVLIAAAFVTGIVKAGDKTHNSK